MDDTRTDEVSGVTSIAEKVPGWALLLSGAAATILVGQRWNVGLLAWVAPIPFLLYLWTRRGWQSKLVLFVVLQIAVNLQILKIVTSPMPPVMALTFGVPLALANWVVYFAWDVVRRRVGERAALYAYPALAALVEVLIYRLTEGGTWGSAAMTQLENLPLLQVASLLGSSAIGFLVAWTASLGALLLAPRKKRQYLLEVAVLGVILFAVLAYGSIRLFTDQEKTVTVAGVVTDLGPSPQGWPDEMALSRNTEELFRRSKVAAERGARLIVWNEGATVVQKGDEQAFIDRGARLSREHGVDLVLAYIVPVSIAPLRFENKYVWIGDDGAALEAYEKHHPVPGEGSVRGVESLRALARPFGTSAGAICYDYDFPAMAVAHGRLGAGLVVLPASDWKGIDPFHSQNVRVRAIEGGFSVVRPTRWATSMAFDAYGRLRGALPAFERNERILFATVPTEHVPTLYTKTGDAVAYAYAAYLLFIMILAIRKAKAQRNE